MQYDFAVSLGSQLPGDLSIPASMLTEGVQGSEEAGEDT